MPVVFIAFVIATVILFAISRNNTTAVFLLIAAGPVVNVTSFHYDSYIYNIEIVLLTYLGCFFWKKAEIVSLGNFRGVIIAYCLLIVAVISSTMVHCFFYGKMMPAEIRLVRLYLIGSSLLAFIATMKSTDLTVFYKGIISVASGISILGLLEFGFHGIVLHNWGQEPRSIFNGSEILAVYLCMILPLVIIGRSIFTKGFWLYIANCSAVMSILLLFAARSRTGILAFLIFILCVGLRNTKLNPQKIIEFGILGFLCGGALIVVGMKTFHSGTMSFSRIPNVVFSSRLPNWQEGITVLSEYPWWGTGSGNNVYNTFLQLQNQFGFIGLITLLFFVGFVFTRHVRNKQLERTNPIQEGVFWSVITVLIAGMGESVLGNQIGYMVLFFSLLL